MASKYAKYIITKHTPVIGDFEEIDPPDVVNEILSMDGRIVKGAVFSGCTWYNKPTRFSPKPHSHDFDEMLAFIGMDPKNPKSLNGEVEFWIEDEKFILKESCLIWIPRGTKHCPLYIRKAERPIFHFGFGTSGGYSRGK
jgi:hypothetical protein